ncbi:ABC transporter permease [Bowmanella sp. JS7-9]|uniref:ABC transporter permease n=1 Tax=Pseudobowmanella zhangzhouensis TaxID=1537679 RepID=A0ABW1XKY6_9ALTE|nr:ABC transporter permease [Bowmanella sp. JS7-9]TBX23078.1 ABC transporter substrate-binding protein [Bowmanella sp. JS7-9]
MFRYYLRLALLSYKRNPILSSLMVLAIAMGIGACMTTITVNYIMSSDPIPQKSEQLFYVQLDSWDPNSPAREPNDPPDQVTWTDATNLMKAKQAFRQSAMARSGGVVEPENGDSKPFMTDIRLAYSDFFAMFNVPFQYGSGWDSQSDDNRDMVVVISRAMNDQLFGGENSVGKTVRLAGHNFRVVGVLKEWRLVPRFYDVTTGAFDNTEDFYMPMPLKESLELTSNGNVNCWKRPAEDGFLGFLYSECVNFQMWVELRDDAEKQAYMAFLNSYADEQRALGRFERPNNNRLSNVMEWMAYNNVVADDAEIMLWLSLMFLLVCLLNTIGLLLAKFSGKAGEISLRRAVGASRRDVFMQHLVETGLIGVIGGIAGLGLAMLGLSGIGVLYGDLANDLTSMDPKLVAIALGLALVSSILAGLYPTWRSTRVAPASQLKSQ